MKIADYLYKFNLEPRDMLAQIDGLKKAALNRYLRQERIPDPAMMAKIEKWTGGLVTRADFEDSTPPECAVIIRLRNGAVRWVWPWTNNAKAIAAAAAMQEEWGLNEPDPRDPLVRAKAVLGPRVRDTGRGMFVLDGRPADTQRVIQRANDELDLLGKPRISYPGKARPVRR